MKPEEFRTAVERGEVLPLYYFHGDEPYLMEKEVRRAIDLLVPDFKDFNVDLFFGSETKGGEIFEAARTLPMFADRRLVIVRKADLLPAAALERLEEYVADPAESSCVIFVGAKVDQRRRFFQEIRRNGALVEFRRPFDNRLPAFIREEAHALGKRIAADAADLLIRLAGNSLQEIATQLEKVAAFAGSEETITAAHVGEVVSETRAQTVFQLAEAVGERDAQGALKGIDSLLRDGAAPIFVVSMLARHFRQLWKVKEMASRGARDADIASRVGMNPYFVPKLAAQAKKYSAGELRQVFRLLYDADSELKGSRVAARVLLERTVLAICG